MENSCSVAYYLEEHSSIKEDAPIEQNKLREI